tara:strand:+ start:24 stop:791 length:768 start_codon:yes stop_codon:yes gene_type:complete
MIDLKNEEILTYLLIIVVGYFIAKMFSRSCNGFSVGAYQCGTCPIVEAKCPHDCNKIENKADHWYCSGREQECSGCPNTTVNSCIPSEASNSLYIGNLDLEIKDARTEIQYKYKDNTWNMYISKNYPDIGKPQTYKSSEVMNTELLTTLNKLKGAPYRIERIALYRIPKVEMGSVGAVVPVVLENVDLPYDYKIKIYSKQVAEQDREFYFTDKADNLYSLSYPGLSAWDLAEFPHVVNYNSSKNKLMYLSYKYKK